MTAPAVIRTAAPVRAQGAIEFRIGERHHLIGDGKLSYLTKGSTGAPTRLFVEWVLSRAG